MCTLWRSRVAHEAHEAPAPPPAAPATPTTAPSPPGEEEEEEEGEGGAAGGAAVRPSLTVVFADGHRLTVTQVQCRPRVCTPRTACPSLRHALATHGAPRIILCIRRRRCISTVLNLPSLPQP